MSRLCCLRGFGRFDGVGQTLSVVVVAIFAGCSTSVRQELSEPSVAESEAMAALAAGHYRESLQVFLRETRRGSPLAFIGAARCYAELGDQPRFEATALEASVAAPPHPSTWSRLGALYIRAAERFRRLPAADKYARLGVDYLRRVLAPGAGPEVLHNLGLGYYLMGEPKLAVVMLDEVLRIQPRDIQARNVLLHALFDLRAQRELVRRLDEADRLGLDPDMWKSFRTEVPGEPAPPIPTPPGL